ncbi:MAG TPA: hypothetical protein VGV38_21385 [Pyrinomonadaceae bacterium]|nr:hypothetical protein [Pyrinomonadaceae bacterium]
MTKGFFSPSRRAWLALVALSVPVLVAVWALRWFVTQDGPAHTHNAEIMFELLRDNAQLAKFYAIRWQPVPNLSGHLLLMGLVAVFPPRVADQLLMTLTAFGFAAAVVWLRRQVRGDQNLWVAAPLGVALGLNWLWLMGFYNFMLGSTLFCLTLGAWWKRRERFGAAQAAWLSVLLVACYMSHPVPLGMTAAGLGVLVLLTPGANFLRRLLWTAAAFLPLVPLAVFYRAKMSTHGGVELHFEGLTNALSPLSWLDYFRGPNLLNLTDDGSRAFPFVESYSSWFLPLSTPLLAAVAVVLLLCALWLYRDGSQTDALARARRAWPVLTLLLAAVCLFGPSHFGVQHGNYIRERVLLMTLAASVTVWNFDASRRLVRLAAVALVLAVAVQSAFVWEYALDSHARVGEYMQAQPHVGTNRRFLTLIPPVRRFRAYSLEHAPELLATGTGNLLWNNYEPYTYYFPVQFHYQPSQCDDFSLGPYLGPDVRFPGSEYNAYKRAWWDCWLSQAHDHIDTIVVWGRDPLVERISEQWYSSQPAFEHGRVRVFHRREEAHGTDDKGKIASALPPKKR